MGGVVQGEAVQQLREALKILAERVLILEHMIGIHGEERKNKRWKKVLCSSEQKNVEWI